MTRSLRPYQTQAIRNIHEAWSVYTSTLLVLATGLGKTFTAASVLAERRKAGRILWIAHRRELITQAREAIESVGLRCEIEMAESWASLRMEGDLFGGHGAEVVIASVQTLTGARLRRFARDAFATIVIDEAHHATAQGYRDIAAHFNAARVLGLTATPDRGDGVGLRAVFESVAFEFGIREGIQQGYLSPIVQKSIECADLDLSDIKTVQTPEGKDLAAGELARAMEADAVLHQVAAPLVEHAGDRSTIVFTASVDQAHALVDVLAGYTQARAAAIDGTTPNELRARILRDFSRGEIQYLTNCAVLTEGFDAPRTSCIAMARPTKSRSLYTQCLDERTQILTDAGWKGIDDAWEDARAAAYDLTSDSIAWHRAERMERPLAPGEQMFGIDGPQMDVRVTGGHRMVVRERHGRARTRTAWRFVRADDLPKEVEIPVCAWQEAPGVALTDAEIRFIGLFLTDGTINQRTGQITIFQSERYPQAIAYVERVIERCGFKFGRSVDTKPTNYGERKHAVHRWTISRGAPRGRDADKRGWGALEAFVDKDVSALFEDLTRGQLLILLEAMEIGDGWKFEPLDYDRSTRVIVSARRAAVDRIQSLCVRRGIRCNVSDISERFFALRYSPDKHTHMLRAHAADSRPTWGELPRRDAERVWCVEVPTGAIVTRRNGRVAIVGNCIGRGTRLFEGKSDCLVLDFVGNSGRHTLVNPLDVLAGKDLPSDVREAAEKKAKGGMPSEQALAEAEREAIERAERAERERARKAKLRAEVAHRARNVDPFGVTSDSDRDGPRASEGQAAALARFGLTAEQAGAMSRREASRMLDELVARSRRGLCSYKQARQMAKHGLRTDLTRAEASEAMDALARNGWRTTPEMHARWGARVEAAE